MLYKCLLRAKNVPLHAKPCVYCYQLSRQAVAENTQTNNAFNEK